MFKIDAADYMLSLCGDDALRELVSPGKSGSVFYLSHDDRFIIKTMKKAEVKVMNYSPFWYTIISGTKGILKFLLDSVWSMP
jgi:hypothetical protein